MAEPPYLFVDFGNTLCDSTEFWRQFHRDLADELALAAGGTADDWLAALEAEAPAAAERYRGRFGTGDPCGYAAWFEGERAAFAEGLFARTGLPVPQADPADALVARLRFDAALRCNAAFDGAEPAMRALFEQGVRVQMAAPEDAQFLIAALIGAGVESYVESKFGPDLVDCAKEGPEFYSRLFAALKITPAQAVVLDDRPDCLAWAAETGARVIQARIAPDAPPAAAPRVIERLVDLPTAARAAFAGPLPALRGTRGCFRAESTGDRRRRLPGFAPV